MATLVQGIQLHVNINCQCQYIVHVWQLCLQIEINFHPVMWLEFVLLHFISPGIESRDMLPLLTSLKGCRGFGLV